MSTMVDTREWTHPRTGEVRRYVQNWAELVGLDVDFYRSGAVSSAALRGEAISNRTASRLLCTKVWVDEAGTVHVERLAEGYGLTAEEIAAAVTDAL